MTPELAVAYVRELSTDVRAVAVLDGGGRLLAGPEALRAPALALAELAGEGVFRCPEGIALIARCGDRAVVVAAGPRALPGPTALDAAAAVAALAGDAPGPPPAFVADPGPEVLAAARALAIAA